MTIVILIMAFFILVMLTEYRCQRKLLESVSDTLCDEIKFNCKLLDRNELLSQHIHEYYMTGKITTKTEENQKDQK